MADDQLSIASPTPVEEAPLSLATTAVPNVQVSDDVAADRAMKVRMGNPKLNLDVSAITDKIRNGGEQNFRTELASKIDYDNTMKSAEVLQNLSTGLGRPLNLPEALLAQDILNKKKTDPDAVIEQGYAEQFMEGLRQEAIRNPDSDIGRAFQDTPTQVEKDMTTGKDYFSKRQRIQTLLENANSAYQQQSYLGAAADWAKGLTGLYESFKLRGLNPNTSVIQYGLGKNIEQQAKDWYHLPFDEFNTKLTATANKLIQDNPGLAQYYLGALLEQSHSEQVMHSVMPALDLTIAADLAKGSVSLYNGLKGISASRTAFRQLMTDIGKASPDSVAGAVGDSQGSGVLRSVSSLIEKMQGKDKPLGEELQRLQSIYQSRIGETSNLQVPRPNKEFIGPLPLSPTGRSIGQETVNRIYDELAKWGDRFFQDVNEAVKLDQVPAAFAVRDKVEKIVEAIKRDYPGWENAVHDVRFTRDAVGNNLYAETYFGKNGFELFKTLREAQSAINNNFNKFGGARIAEAYGPPKPVPTKVVGKPKEPLYKGQFTRAQAQDIQNQSKQNLANIEKTIADPSEAKRDPGKVAHLKSQIPSLRQSIAETEAFLSGSHLPVPHLERGIHDVFVGELDNAELRAATTGKDTYNKRTLYPDLGHIQEMDDRIPPRFETEIRQQGAGYYIVHRAPVDLTSPEMRMALLSTSDAKTPMSTVNAFGGWLGKLRTPEDTLSREQNFARKVATYVPNKFVQTQKELTREIDQTIPKWSLRGFKKNEVWTQWKSVMDLAMTVPDAETGARGRLNFRSVGELGDLYLQKLNRVPSPAEVKASFLAKAFDENVESFNKIREFNRQTRLGAETWEFKVGDVSRETRRGEASGGAYPFKYVSANGIVQHEFPGTGNVLILGEMETDATLVTAAQINESSKIGKALRAQVAAGKGSLVRLTDPTAFPFSKLGGVGDQMVHYVYAGTTEAGRAQVERKALDWNLLRTGRPARFDYDHYVVQPNIHYDRLSETHSYLGDTTVAGFNIRAMGRDVATKLNEIRKFLAADDVNGARTYHGSSGLEQDFDTIRSWFRADVTPEGLPVGPKLNLLDDIVLAPYGKTSLDLGKDLERKYKNFKDMTREYYGHLLDDRRDPFDVFTYKNEGSKQNPLYKMTPVKYIDPLTTLNRGMSRAINGMYLDPYKNMSVEHWIQEVKDHVTVSDKGLASSPEYWFYTLAAENHWKAGTPDVIKNNLMTANMQIRQFLGIQDKMDTWLHQTAQTLADSIYGYNPKLALVPNYLLPTLRDPFAFMRSVGFHAKLGLWSIPQLFVQANTFSAIFGIAGPDRALAGTKAAMFHMWTRFNKSPEILDHIDSLVSSNVVPGSKWLPGQWKEAHDLLTRTGIEQVGQEHIFRDSTHYYDFFGSKLQGFLDAGTFFFRESERQVRTGAFYTAYREIRDQLSHTGPLTAAEERAVIQRADLLSINMTRASASMIHKGIFSVPTQFMSYTLRMSELVLGKRLTPTEKARLFAVNATLYGVPAAFGISGLPIGDVINKTALENGYVPGSPENSYLNSAITEGLPALGLALVSGNWYNVGERYANPGGINIIRDTIRGDKSFLETILGAPYSIGSNILASKDPFLQMTLSAIRGDGAFKPKVEDFADIFKEVSSVYGGLRLLAAINTHNWISKNEGYLGDVSTANALWMTITGLSPRELSDIPNMQWTKDQEKEAQKLGIQRFVKESQRSFIEREKGNMQQADDYQRRAWRWMDAMGVPPDRYAEAVAIAAQGYISIINRTKEDYYSKHIPPERYEAARKGLDQTRQIRYGTTP